MTLETLPLSKSVVSKERATHFYMKINVETEDTYSANVTINILKSLITNATTSLFGSVGAIINVKILYFNETTGEGIIKVPSSGVVQLWTSLTWFPSNGQQRVKINTIKISPYLASLSKDSRQYQHKKINP